MKKKNFIIFYRLIAVFLILSVSSSGYLRAENLSEFCEEADCESDFEIETTEKSSDFSFDGNGDSDDFFISNEANFLFQNSIFADGHNYEVLGTCKTIYPIYLLLHRLKLDC